MRGTIGIVVRWAVALDERLEPGLLEQTPDNGADLDAWPTRRSTGAFGSAGDPGRGGPGLSP